MPNISLKKAVERLLENDKILLLCHRNPDGDTVGSAFALCRALRSLGKRVNVMCGDIIPAKFDFIFGDIQPDDIREQFIVAVDVASAEMLGVLEKDYKNKVNLCIDHHGSNTGYAKETFVDSDAAAVGEIIFRMLPMLGAELTKPIAAALYTSLTTDTGCFCYSNVTAATHRIAAKLIETGFDAYSVNRRMFETKSRSRLELERRVMDTLCFHADGCIAVMHITEQMLTESGASEGETDGLASFPRQIEGVKIGLLLREVKGGIKVSARSVPGVDASEMCARLGGGGHPAAAGGFIKASMEEAIDIAIEAAEAQLNGQ